MRIVLSLVLGVLLFTALAGCGKLSSGNAAVTESEEQRQSRQLGNQADALDARLGVETKALSISDRVSALENASGLAIKWDGGMSDIVDALADFHDVKDGALVSRVDELGKKMDVSFEGSGVGLVVRVKALKDSFHSQPEPVRAQLQLARLGKYVARVEKLENFLSISAEKKEFGLRLLAAEKELLRGTDPIARTIRERLTNLEAAAGI